MDILVQLEESPEHSPVLAHVNSVSSPLDSGRPTRDVVTLYGVPSLESLALALAAAVLVPDPVPSVLAFAVAGLGVGNIAPVLFAGGGRAEPDAPGRGIAAVTTMGYSGFLVGPPFIGMVADQTGLTAALLLTVFAALVIASAPRAARAADGLRSAGPSPAAVSR